jgi:hypothetical protein
MTALRSDVDLTAVNRRLGTMAEKYKVDDQFEQQSKKLESMLKHQQKVDLSLTKLISNSGSFQERLDLIYDRQAEVRIGKRNTNCLSCAEEPKNANLIGLNGKVY